MGSAAWLFQRITGVVLLVGMIIHFRIMHYSGTAQLTHAVVLERLSNPYWKAFNLLFLVCVIWHGLSGIWGIANEYAGSKAVLLKFCQAIIILSGSILTVTGIYIVWGNG